jgi:rRNA-processing protein FCF1
VQGSQLVEVVCDTSFLMLIASKKIKNISQLETEIGAIVFVVPDSVVSELVSISNSNNKKKVWLCTH